MHHIRLLTPQDDLAAAAQVYTDSWKSTYERSLPQRFLDKLTPERWLGMLRADPSASLGLFENGRIIGTAMVNIPRGEIVSLYLLPEAVGKGWGRQLLHSAMEVLLANGCEKVCLWVMCQNTHAISFYLRQGFHPTGRVMEETYGTAAAELMEMVRLLP